MAKRMPFPAGLLAVIVLVLVHRTCSFITSNQCPISSCGGIDNIKYPFQLIDDPPNCGDQRYNLSCENNQTVLYLSNGVYYVQEISYDATGANDFRIRVVDSRIPNDNYSSTPLCSSYFDYDLKAWEPYRPSQENGVVFVSYEKPVNSPFYLNASSCFDDEAHSSNSSSSHSKRRHRYILSGQMNASVLMELCQPEHRCLSSWPRNDDINISCTDVHNMLLYGFELLPWPVFKCTFGRSVCSPEADNRVYCQCIWTRTLLIKYYSIEIAFFAALAIGAHFALKIVFGTPCVILLLIYKWRKRHSSMYDAIEEFLQSHNKLRPIRYSYKEIKKMTNNFKDKLGEGGYGTVFKGTLRSGQLVAVKMLGKTKLMGKILLAKLQPLEGFTMLILCNSLAFALKGQKELLFTSSCPKAPSINTFLLKRKVSS